MKSFSLYRPKRLQGVVRYRREFSSTSSSAEFDNPRTSSHFAVHTEHDIMLGCLSPCSFDAQATASLFAFQDMSPQLRAPTVVDLFCGAGGMSLGFERAGFRVVRAVDCWPPAVETYRKNFGEYIRECRITPDIDVPQATIIVGGPPCQGFSSAGRRADGDDRNSLVGVFANIVARLRPAAFMFENVEGFLTGVRGRAAGSGCEQESEEII